MVLTSSVVKVELSLIILQGLENSWKRHQDTIEHFWAGLESMGLELFVEDKVKWSYFSPRFKETDVVFNFKISITAY